MATFRDENMGLPLIERLRAPLPQRVINVDSGEKTDEYRLSISSAERATLIHLLSDQLGAEGLGGESRLDQQSSRDEKPGDPFLSATSGRAAPPTQALSEIVNRAANFMDADAADWMPSIYKIACEAIGSDPWPLLRANGWSPDRLSVGFNDELSGEKR